MAHAGRPKVDNPKSIKYSIRIDAETEAQLLEYCKENDITKGEAFRLAIEQLLKKRR